jgi:hemerythrin
MPIDYPALPVPFMNEDHAHAAALIETMCAALPACPVNVTPLIRACRAFLEHNRGHFAREEEAMRNSGFPAYPIHKNEHDQVLAWLESRIEAISGGLPCDTAQTLVEQEIPAWFVRHIETMDRATANWIANHTPTSGVCV